MVAFFNNRDVLPQGVLSLTDCLLQSFDVVFLHNLVIRLAEAYLPAQELNFLVGVVLHAGNRLLFTVSPNLV